MEECATIYDVAAYILEKLGKVTTMKLQKLCFYCQAWSMAWEEEPLFREDFEAWANGPVCPALFHKHKGKYSLKKGDITGSGYAFSEKEIETMDLVINHYGKWEPWELSDSTHSELPWKKARGNTPIGEPCNTVISLDSMRDFYGDLSATNS